MEYIYLLGVGLLVLGLLGVYRFLLGIHRAQKEALKIQQDRLVELQDHLKQQSWLTQQMQQQVQQVAQLVQQQTGQLTNLERQTQGSFKAVREEQILMMGEARNEWRMLLREGIQDILQHQQTYEALQKEKLQEIKLTVAEKLEKTLSERLGQSFETVGKQLLLVQKGLGEMQHLAQDVGSLKKVLSNVKMSGGFGEIQLAMLLEQLLSPQQYAANVQTTPRSLERVEFAIRLPGAGASGVPVSGTHPKGEAGKANTDQVWLPIDAKFPREAYEALQQAYDLGEPAAIASQQKQLEQVLRKMAKEIKEKYIHPPYTTDFAILFLPFEGIYAEVVRRAALLQEIQWEHQVVVVGPATLGALLNSLQMGFKTLAIQQRSSEVWQVLAAVKKEFAAFGGLLEKAQKNFQTGMQQLDDVMGKRTRAIQRSLRQIDEGTTPSIQSHSEISSEMNYSVDTNSSSDSSFRQIPSEFQQSIEPPDSPVEKNSEDKPWWEELDEDISSPS